jgi:hypothetical protein
MEATVVRPISSRWAERSYGPVVFIPNDVR